MIQIRYYLNYRMLTLDENPEGEVFTVLRSGDYRSMWWLGIIDVEIARQLPGARPVKFDATEVSYDDDPLTRNWEFIPKDMCLQGCMIRHGVFGVTEGGRLKVLPRPGERHTR